MRTITTQAADCGRSPARCARRRPRGSSRSWRAPPAQARPTDRGDPCRRPGEGDEARDEDGRALDDMMQGSGADRVFALAHVVRQHDRMGERPFHVRRGRTDAPVLVAADQHQLDGVLVGEVVALHGQRRTQARSLCGDVEPRLRAVRETGLGDDEGADRRRRDERVPIGHLASASRRAGDVSGPSRPSFGPLPQGEPAGQLLPTPGFGSVHLMRPWITGEIGAFAVT